MERQVKLRNLLAYGIGDIYGGGSFFIISTLFLFFLTQVVGLHPVRAGLVIAVGKIWDAISDPLMGYISDHMKTGLGRRRIFFLVGFLPVGISFALLWIRVTFLPEHLLFLWYLFAYILFSTVFTMMMVPYSALNAEMSTDYRIRTRLSGARMIFSQCSALIAGVVPILIIERFPAEQGYMIMGVVFGIFYTLPWLFVFWGTWELPYSLPEQKESFRKFYGKFLSILHNRSFRIHIVMYISAYTAMDIMMAIFIYYITYYMKMEQYFPLFLGSLVLTQIAFLPVYVKLCNVIGKGKAYMIGLAIWGVGLFFLYTLTPSTPLAFIFPVVIICGMGLSAGVMIPWAMLPTVTDVDELITTERRAGIYAGMMTLLRKGVQALTLLLVGVILSAIGFVSGAETQSPATLQNLRLFFVLAPLIFIILGELAAYRFKITPETHKMMTDEIRRLREGGGRENVDPEAKRVCEQLTGFPYEKLYR